MERKELRGEINRVMLIVAALVVVALAGVGVFVLDEMQRRNDEARIASNRKYREVMWQAEAATRGYKVP